MMDDQKRIDIKFLLLFIPVAYGSYLFHEFGHWSVGEILGNRMAYSLNYVWPKDGSYIQPGHDLYVLIGGPSFSVLQAFLSLLFGGFSKQDEAKISALMGTGTFLVAVIVLVILLSIVIRSSYKLGIGFQ